MHRSPLSLALGQWARRQAGNAGNEALIVRGNREILLSEAVAPLMANFASQAFDKFAQSLSLIS
jgi:hypothetical protein